MTIRLAQHFHNDTKLVSQKLSRNTDKFQTEKFRDSKLMPFSNQQKDLQSNKKLKQRNVSLF